MTAMRMRNEPSDLVSQRVAAVEQARELTKRLRAFGIRGDLATVIRAAAVVDHLSEWDRVFLNRITPRVQAGLQISTKQRHVLRRIERDLDAMQRRA